MVAVIVKMIMDKEIAELADEFTKRWGYKNGMFTDVKNVITSAVAEAKRKQNESFEIVRKETIKLAKIVGHREGVKEERERKKANE